MDSKLPAILFFVLSVLLTLPAVAEEEGGGQASSVQYHELTPAFVANFGDGNEKKLKFLKAGISVRVSSGSAIDALMNHDALVRHEIVMLLSRQTDDALASSAGQEKVRVAALKAVQAALEEETGDGQIDDLLFTSFVVQR